MCLYQTSGRRPPRITGRFAITVTRGWVGAPNERAPFRFHGAVVGFIDQCQSRTRNLELTFDLSFSEADLGLTSAQELLFSFFFKFGTFFSKTCAHSERYRNLVAGIFELQTFLAIIAFP